MPLGSLIHILLSTYVWGYVRTKSTIKELHLCNNTRVFMNNLANQVTTRV